MHTPDDAGHRHPLLPRLGLAALLVALFFAVRFEWQPWHTLRIDVLGFEVVHFEAERPAPPAPPAAIGPRPAPAPAPPPPDAGPFVVVEQMPELIGGLAVIQRKIRYPEIARKAGVEGRVIVQFVVDEQGRVVDPVVVRDIGAGCDEEAVRAVRQVRFRPGSQHGKPVPVSLSLPITFRLP